MTRLLFSVGTVTKCGIRVSVDSRFADPEPKCSVGLMSQMSQNHHWRAFSVDQRMATFLHGRPSVASVSGKRTISYFRGEVLI